MHCARASGLAKKRAARAQSNAIKVWLVDSHGHGADSETFVPLAFPP
jgi:hypothetical protein